MKYVFLQSLSDLIQTLLSVDTCSSLQDDNQVLQLVKNHIGFVCYLFICNMNTATEIKISTVSRKSLCSLFSFTRIYTQRNV